MKKALLPVRRRLRLRHAARGFCWGLLAMGAADAAVMALSFALPLHLRTPLLLAALALPLLGAAAGLLWPVPLLLAARAADACGLRERAQTALALRGREDDMARLQRADALSALQGLNARKALPLRAPRRVLIAAAACLALCAALAFVPNPQDDVLRAQQQFMQKMEKPKEVLAEALKALDEAELDAQTMQDLRRLTGDLARELAQSRDRREALTALSRAQQQMEKLLNQSKNAAGEALGQAGLDALAQALNAAGADAQSLEEALSAAAEGMDAQQLAEQLEEAAQSASDAAAAQALKAAAQALSQGSASAAAQALSQLSAQSAAASQLAAAMQGAKAAAGLASGGQGASGQGQGQGQGQGAGQSQGQGQGGGAGKGSTNQDQSGAGGAKGGHSAGKDPGQYNLGAYESIYDPTRLGDGGEISQSTGKVNEQGEISELTLGPGLGDASGSVPYDQVAGAYRDAAVQRAREAQLPAYAQQWVNDYFGALVE